MISQTNLLALCELQNMGVVYLVRDKGSTARTALLCSQRFLMGIADGLDQEKFDLRAFGVVRTFGMLAPFLDAMWVAVSKGTSDADLRFIDQISESFILRLADAVTTEGV